MEHPILLRADALADEIRAKGGPLPEHEEAFRTALAKIEGVRAAIANDAELGLFPVLFAAVGLLATVTGATMTLIHLNKQLPAYLGDVRKHGNRLATIATVGFALWVLVELDRGRRRKRAA